MSKNQERLARLRRAARLLGDLEPSHSHDHSPEGWGESGDGDDQNARDQQIRRDVPPHHVSAEQS